MGVDELPTRAPGRGASRSAQVRRNLPRDLVAFIGTLVAAVCFDWQARDVIWGLWICSFTYGYACIVSALLIPIARAGECSRRPMLMSGLFLLCFFTMHFGLFHIVHGQFLNQFFPLGGQATGFLGVFTLITWPLSLYWPMVLATFISRFYELPFNGANPAGGTGGIGALFIKPYANVIRMHLLIFVFAGLDTAGLSDIALYPVLLFYFFPWRACLGRHAGGE
ncbi:MAG: hypothetical protein CMP28_06805 [Roseibacillus sp.]|nr:hypothetical protein [Roseibacillus sp.]